MFAPFNVRHEKIFADPFIVGLVESIEQDKNALNNFAKACIDHCTTNFVSADLQDLAIDAAICTRDFRSLLKLTEALARPEYYLYRAYAYSRLNMTNKIVSLKLQFQQKYSESLESPRNAFVTASLEFLLLYGEQNYPMALTTVEEIDHHITTFIDEFEGKLTCFLIYTLAAQGFLLISDFDKVEDLARRVLQSAVKQRDPYFQSVALNLITTVFINKGEFKKAQKMLNAAIVPTEETGLAADRASLLNNSAKLELARGDFERSIRLLRQIHKLVSKNPRAKAVSAANIAELCLLLERYEEAREMLDVALRLDEEMELNLIQPYLLSAWIAIERDNYELAETSIQMCKLKLDEVGELRVKPNIYYYEGLLHKKRGMVDEAITAFQISNKAASDLDNVEFLIKAQFELAGLHLDRFNENNELTDYSAVLGYLNNLTYLSEEQFIPRLMCDIQMLKGLLLIHGNKPEKAMDAIADAYELAKKFNYPKVQREAQLLLGEIDKDQKIERFAAILEEKGFEQSDRMSETLKKYQGFKFVKAPKVVGSKLYGLALVDADTAVMKYRFTTKHEYQDEASLVPMLVAAINTFSQSVLEEDLVLSEVTQEGRDLLIDMIEDRIIIAITEKITFNLKNQFAKYVSTLRNFIPKIEPVGTQDIHIELLDRISIIYFLQEGILQERTKQQKLDLDLDASLRELEDVIAQVEADLRELLERSEQASAEEIITQVDGELRRIDQLIRAKDPKLLAYIETYGIPVAKSYDDALDLHETETVDLVADEVELGAKEEMMTGFEHEFTLKQEDLAELGVQLEDLDHGTDLDQELHEIESDLEEIEKGRIETPEEVVLEADVVTLETEDLAVEAESMGIPKPPDKEEEEIEEEPLEEIIPGEEFVEIPEPEEVEDVRSQEFNGDMIDLRPPPDEEIVELKPAETLDVNVMDDAPQMDEILLDSDEVVLDSDSVSFTLEAEELVQKAEEVLKKAEDIDDEEEEE
jgi:tetratricopeptide (TPR) repeat protein